MPTTSTLAAPNPVALNVNVEFSARRSVWIAAIAGSRLPQILCHECGRDFGFTLPIIQTIVLVLWAICLAGWQKKADTAGFVLAVASLCFTWSVAGPWLDQSGFIQAVSQHLSWSGRFYLSRVIRLIGIAILLATFVGSGITSRDLFLRHGNWRALAHKNWLFRWRVSWGRLALTLSLIFVVIVSAHLTFTTRPDLENAFTLPLLLLSCVPIAALNAANEEFQFRSALLARLNRIVPPGEAALVCGVVFGIGHYFGHPAGWGGVLIAGFGGWVWARSMNETQGFTLAWTTHFLQDMLIFVFIALAPNH